MARGDHIILNLIPCQRWVADIDLIRLGSLSEAHGFPFLILPTHNVTPASGWLQKEKKNFTFNFRSIFNNWHCHKTENLMLDSYSTNQSWHRQGKVNKGKKNTGQDENKMDPKPGLVLSMSHDHAIDRHCIIFSGHHLICQTLGIWIKIEWRHADVTS